MSEENTELDEPYRRPAAVPPAAAWIGGPDGGVFIVLTPDPGRGAFACTVYNDHTGEVEAAGFCRPSGISKAKFEPGIPEISAWDGENLHLARGDAMPLLNDADLQVLDRRTKA